jgi:hypothetical protein
MKDGSLPTSVDAVIYKKDSQWLFSLNLNHTVVKIALAAGIIEPNHAVVISDSIWDDGQIEWLNYTDNSSAFSSEDTSIALTNNVWEYLLDYGSTCALDYATRTKVFGRCTPDDKVSIVRL